MTLKDGSKCPVPQGGGNGQIAFVCIDRKPVVNGRQKPRGIFVSLKHPVISLPDGKADDDAVTIRDLYLDLPYSEPDQWDVKELKTTLAKADKLKANK